MPVAYTEEALLHLNRLSGADRSQLELKMLYSETLARIFLIDVIKNKEGKTVRGLGELAQNAPDLIEGAINLASGEFPPFIEVSLERESTNDERTNDEVCGDLALEGKEILLQAMEVHILLGDSFAPPDVFDKLLDGGTDG